MACLNKNVTEWVDSVASRLRPEKIVWVSGSAAEYERLCNQLVADGTFIRLNPELFPGCYLARSHPSDVARVENRTFICAADQDEAGPTNNWRDPKEMYRELYSLLDGSMAGRTMYVVPYLMGPDGSPYARVGFELTDSPYVVANMAIMARIGDVALENLGETSNDFVRGIHSVGTLDPERRFICHFPQDNTIISVNSNYGGNALQGKKCFALRMASILARNQGWLAEHMLILGIENPKGEKKYMCAAFPSGCGKTNLAMVIPPKSFLEAGWKVTTVGDDIAWLNFGQDGRLYAINPEAGFFGIAPGTSEKTNPNALATIKKNTIFTNVALNEENMTPWWDGLSEPPSRLIDWHGKEWKSGSPTKPAHPNSRFTAPAKQCPSIDPAWEAAGGVPISAIIFGGRRAHLAPLVMEARDWRHGTFLGVTMASEMTAAAEGKVGDLRRDSMAMTPFIGYHAGDYFAHWLSIGETAGAVLPKIFHVNWFRKDHEGKFLWPGFGDNVRVLEWIFNRCDEKIGAEEKSIGLLPRADDLNVTGLSMDRAQIEALFAVNPEDWSEELASQEKYFNRIGDKFPRALWEEHRLLRARLGV